MENTTESPRKKKRRLSGRAVTVILVAVLVVGLGVLVYPSISSWWNARVQTRAVLDYEETADTLSREEIDAIFTAAEAYNEELYRVGSPAALSDPDILDGYFDLLNVTETGIMGYVSIDRIDCELPIYHTTSDDALAAGAGHLQGSSLPVGGENTHAVISAHRGLPYATMFTNLNKLEVGDTFTITVLDRILTYEVDQISIVEPDEFEDLFIEDGEDYCTLMTCTPYGINSQRLLVRGKRIETPDSKYLRVSPEADRVNYILVAVAIAVPLLIILLIIYLVRSRRRRMRRNSNEK